MTRFAHSIPNAKNASLPLSTQTSFDYDYAEKKSTYLFVFERLGTCRQIQAGHDLLSDLVRLRSGN